MTRAALDVAADWTPDAGLSAVISARGRARIGMAAPASPAAVADDPGARR
jgi:hypothetical protein